MIEVFKTNVRNKEDATMLIDRIHTRFTGCQANFDLEDCDKILRVSGSVTQVQPALLIGMLSHSGFHAEILPDEKPWLVSAI
jgi:hypothetical protein